MIKKYKYINYQLYSLVLLVGAITKSNNNDPLTN